MLTYLYVKQHSKTKLKYFGKTQKDPYLYKGSGTYWLDHIRKYGAEYVNTLEVIAFEDQKLCTEYALHFSRENNIVISEEWANLREENGLDGNLKGVVFTNEHKQKLSDARNRNKCKPLSDQHRSNLRKARATQPPRSFESRARSSSKRMGAGNPRAITVVFMGVTFGTIKEFATTLNLTKGMATSIIKKQKPIRPADWIRVLGKIQKFFPEFSSEEYFSN